MKLKNKIAPFEYITQRPHENLCWAACVAMILRWLMGNKNVGLLFVLEKYFTPKNRSLSEIFSMYNITVKNSEILEIFKNHKVSCIQYDHYIIHENVIKLIDNGTPILITIKSNNYNYSEHAVIVIGYVGDDYIIQDPYLNYESSIVNSSELQNGYADSSWYLSWYNFQKN